MVKYCKIIQIIPKQISDEYLNYLTQQTINQVLENENILKSHEDDIKMIESQIFDKQKTNEKLEDDMKVRLDELMKVDNILKDKQKIVDTINDNITTLKSVVQDLKESNVEVNYYLPVCQINIYFHISI